MIFWSFSVAVSLTNPLGVAPPPSSSRITAQPNTAYVPIVPSQTTPAIATSTNMAHAVFPTHNDSDYESVQ